MPEMARPRPARAAAVASRPVVLRAALPLRPLPRRSLRGALLGGALVGGAALAAIALVMGDQLAGGDSGQWVMLARAYDGLSLPAYRDPLAVPPAAPLLVLGLWKLTGDPYLAPKLAEMLAYALVCVAAFWLGREVWGWLPGLGVGAVTAVGQHFYLRLAVFGALPQLLALACFAAALAMCARRVREPAARGPVLGLGLACIGIVASHEPTAVIALPVLGGTLLLLPPRPSLRGAVVRALPVVPAFGATAFYTLLQRGTFESYVNNEAAFYAKGLDSALAELLALRLGSLVLVGAGAVLLLVLVRGLLAARARHAMRPRPPSRVAGWLVPPPERRAEAALAAMLLGLPVLLLGCAVLALHVMRVGTDYPRIFPLVAIPALASLGVLIPDLRPPKLPDMLPARQAAVVGVAGLMLLPLAGSVVAVEQGAMGYYSVRAPDDLRAALGAVAREVPRDGVVLTPVREGKWLEGITGRTALFALPAWAIFRPWEWERKESAEAILGTSASISTGLIAAGTQRNLAVDDAQPMVRAYFHGDLVPILRLDDGDSGLMGLLPSPPSFPVARLTDRWEQVAVEGGGASIAQQARGSFGATHVEVDRQVRVAEGGSSVDIALRVRSDGAPLTGAWFALRPPEGAAWSMSIDPDAPSDALLDVQLESGLLHARVHAGPPGMARLVPVARGIDVQLTPTAGGTEAGATLTIDAAPVGHAKPQLRALTAQQALDRSDAGWALLPKSMGNAQAAVQGLGFRAVWDDATYTLYKRGGP